MDIRSKAIPLPIDNIDTDQIIPAKFLKQTDRLGYGKNLFYAWRYLQDGSPNPDFELNNPARKDAEILIAGNNFGCGSSREHAAWAVADYGIKVVLSTQFADIFKGNAYNNGILPVELDERSIADITQLVLDQPATEIEVSLQHQLVKVSTLNLEKNFHISPFKKECLLNGVDETDYLINLRGEVTLFEQQR
ncbi:3-isopropylmalate/(R)-2-methylmalate dehydratase small subunit [Ekhidna lutea]|uniref:3-isopropylmalate dehydratase small subunit n=1 Tax=Ekhidna lutea TaxID=447679 RepID=A0A239J1Z9_EKHLU|nr:3-isopropylmalate dehydratase small subunit [Ekhidna lutea]SNS98684.1 3-isopropylmalate/(R)-2-methylmalate dehydratase small subunit [Ekhidna lutea]